MLLLLAAAGVATSGIASRLHDEDKLTRWTDDQAIPTVALTTPQPERADKEIVLPGDVEAFYSASIHGQASGYVHEWRYDIGASVRRATSWPSSTRRSSTSASLRPRANSRGRKPIKRWP